MSDEKKTVAPVEATADTTAASNPAAVAMAAVKDLGEDVAKIQKRMRVLWIAVIVLIVAVVLLVVVQVAGPLLGFRTMGRGGFRPGGAGFQPGQGQQFDQNGNGNGGGTAEPQP